MVSTVCNPIYDMIKDTTYAYALFYNPLQQLCEKDKIHKHYNVHLKFIIINRNYCFFSKICFSRATTNSVIHLQITLLIIQLIVWSITFYFNHNFKSMSYKKLLFLRSMIKECNL